MHRIREKEEGEKKVKATAAFAKLLQHCLARETCFWEQNPFHVSEEPADAMCWGWRGAGQGPTPQTPTALPAPGIVNTNRYRRQRQAAINLVSQRITLRCLCSTTSKLPITLPMNN